MEIYSSENFISLAASGEDWRDVAKAILSRLSEARVRINTYTLGFIYLTEELAADVNSILTLFRSVTSIEHWVGAVGPGACCVGAETVGTPSISLMLGRFGVNDFQVFAGKDEIPPHWLDNSEPLLTLVHAAFDPDSDQSGALNELEEMTGGFLAGGLSFAQDASAPAIANGPVLSGLSGVMFDRDVAVATIISQGCEPIGPIHAITRCEGRIVRELDGENPLEVLSEDLRLMAGAGRVRAGGGAYAPIVPEPAEQFEGEIHAGFLVSGSDSKDYLVRRITGMDPDRGVLSVARDLTVGDQMMFVRRDAGTAQTSLSRALLDLRARVISERGSFVPAGALFITGAERSLSDFSCGVGSECALVREVIGDIPLAGFYAGGEISNRQLYEYAAVLILFL